MTDFRLNNIDFSDSIEVLKKAAKVVRTEIVRLVVSRQQPDGSPQKQNATSTVLKKGHDHPLVEKKGRFQNPGTYHIEQMGPDAVSITMSSEDSNVAAQITRKGYDFFDVTPEAEREAYRMMDQYLARKVREAFRGGHR